MTTAAHNSDNTMKIIETPASNDILCGKDKTFNRNIGNMMYRQLIIATAPRYTQIKTKPEKMKITAHIVHTMIHVHNSRFLKQVLVHDDFDDVDDGTIGNSEFFWQEISITAARDKTSHALRFCASQMHLQKASPTTVMKHDDYEYDESTTTTTGSSTIPVTPPTIRRSIRGRVQRKSMRYSPSSATTASKAKRNPVRHRRTVSSENAAVVSSMLPMVVSSLSIDPNEYMYDNNHHHHHFYQSDQYHHYQQLQQSYYQPMYHSERYHPYSSDDHPVPMECSSAYVSPTHANQGASKNYDNTYPQYDTMPSTVGKHNHRSPAMATPTTSTKKYKNDINDEEADDDDDDLDAILREPIHWDDDDDDDDGEANKDVDEMFQL